MPDTAQFILSRLSELAIKRVHGYPSDSYAEGLGLKGIRVERPE